jgi:expansin (peptidoglycan-binding protein)
MAGYRETSGWDADRFVFIAVETEPPYATGVYMLDPPALQSGRTIMEIAAARYAQARQGGTFAGYAEDVIELSLPGWALIDPAFKKVNNGLS